MICSVAPDGTFTAETPEYQGRWVKDCDRDIIRQLKAEGLLFHQEQYVHDYPFCWRAEEDPLIQYPRKSWFIRTTAFKEKMLANNSRINWLPEHIRDGRFGNFLETNVDWALSRERYWGTPLPIWVCEKTGYAEAVGSYAELLAKPGVTGTEVWASAKKENPELPDDLKVHKPYIDAVTYASPKAKGARMRRVSEVIDCWFDSGAMPFAQWGYPHQPGSAERFAGQFPADFISEALDQTRGWFYSLLAISTLLFSEDAAKPQAANPKSQIPNPKSTNPSPLVPLLSPLSYPHPFRNCIVLGLMLGEDGGKMSKSKRNYREPGEIFDRYGADALRWYFFANQPPWTSIRYSEQAIKDCIPEFLLRLWNVYSFFVIYANIDGFDPAAEISGRRPASLVTDVLAKAKTCYRPVADARRVGPLDSQRIEPHGGRGGRADGRLRQFRRLRAADGVRRRPEQLVRSPQPRPVLEQRAVARQGRRLLDALRVPFDPLEVDCPVHAVSGRGDVAESGWRNVFEPASGRSAARKRALVRLSASATPAAIDEQLSQRMALMREIVSLGRSARMGAKLKVRQPLKLVEVCWPTNASAVARRARLA